MDIQKMIDSYANWIKERITFEKVNEYYEITTPYLDRFDDFLQIYVKQLKDGTIYMTDDGYIIGNLLSCGLSLRKNSNKFKILERIVINYGLQLKGEEITTKAELNNFPLKKHLMVQAMLSVDNMFELRKENVKNLFLEDVIEYFDKNDIFYTRDFSIVGKTGNIYSYDFHFQRSKNNSNERFCRTINKLNKTIRDSTIFNWIDTKEKRTDKSELIVILNDENQINKTDENALNEYEIQTIKFCDIGKFLSCFI